MDCISLIQLDSWDCIPTDTLTNYANFLSPEIQFGADFDAFYEQLDT